ncbi:hypothetical protein F4810DRAFT_707101 [Camillea tinctor]|nr:hypothetical protein F4810DRAFT_707101 [Camillea tinctor]
MKLTSVYFIFASLVTTSMAIEPRCEKIDCGSLATRGKCVDYCNENVYKRGLQLRRPHPRALLYSIITVEEPDPEPEPDCGGDDIALIATDDYK